MTSVPDLSTGQIIADKYRVDGLMGTGGMGVVVAATHIELEQRVAIKFLRETNAEALARFQREARLAVRLKNPHVTRVFDVGALEDQTPYIVMELLEGEDLASVLAARGPLPYETALDYVLEASEAVAEAHSLGMIHRDLKPANLFLARGVGGRDSIKVLDFGVSKIRDDRLDGDDDATRSRDLTHEGTALGSPGYMSPEQMTSARDVDVRTDIFALGAILYRLITGEPPFKGKTIVSLLAAMATERPQPMTNLVPRLPGGLAAAVERCLQRDREERWPTVAHLAQALAPHASARARMSVEQILATLDMTVPKDRPRAVEPASEPSEDGEDPDRTRQASFPPRDEDMTRRVSDPDMTHALPQGHTSVPTTLLGRPRPRGAAPRPQTPAYAMRPTTPPSRSDDTLGRIWTPLRAHVERYAPWLGVQLDRLPRELAALLVAFAAITLAGTLGALLWRLLA